MESIIRITSFVDNGILNRLNNVRNVVGMIHRKDTNIVETI